MGTFSGATLKLCSLNLVRKSVSEKAAELPVQQATAVKLIINLKAAKALKLAVPLPLLGRADEVIE